MRGSFASLRMTASCLVLWSAGSKGLPLGWIDTSTKVFVQRGFRTDAIEFCAGGLAGPAVCGRCVDVGAESTSGGGGRKIFHSPVAARDWEGELFGYGDRAGTAGDDDEFDAVGPRDEADERCEAGDG